MKHSELGAICFFCRKMSAVCGPHLQTSAREEVDQKSAVCKEKRVCFFYFYKKVCTLQHTQQTQLFSLPVPSSTTTTTTIRHHLTLTTVHRRNQHRPPSQPAPPPAFIYHHHSTLSLPSSTTTTTSFFTVTTTSPPEE
ncbi:hypothetical protein Hanom_Chr05g00471681 [Helianthus anomalus]